MRVPVVLPVFFGLSACNPTVAQMDTQYCDLYKECGADPVDIDMYCNKPGYFESLGCEFDGAKALECSQELPNVDCDETLKGPRLSQIPRACTEMCPAPASSDTTDTTDEAL
jgi:hypothetical protein